MQRPIPAAPDHRSAPVPCLSKKAHHPMKNIFSAFFLIFISTPYSSAQSGLQRIEVMKGFPKYAFRYNELTLGVGEVASLVKKNEQAYKLIKPARINHHLADFFTVAGVAGVLSPLQLLIPSTSRAGNNGRSVWPFFGIGLGAFAIAIPLAIKSEKQAAKSISIYNGDLGVNRYKSNTCELKFGSVNTGMGVALKF
jgi:hypothetical protein